MPSLENEMTDLMRQHEAIKAEMGFLMSSLSSLDTPTRPLKDQLWGYHQGLRDFREGVLLHIELDKRIFAELPANASVAKVMKEHETIRKQMDGIIRLVNNAIDKESDQEWLNQSVLNFREAYNKIRKLIEAHILKEDQLLKQWLKGK